MYIEGFAGSCRLEENWHSRFDHVTCHSCKRSISSKYSCISSSLAEDVADGRDAERLELRVDVVMRLG